MNANQAQNAKPNEALCPFLRPAQAEGIYPIPRFLPGPAPILGRARPTCGIA